MEGLCNAANNSLSEGESTTSDICEGHAKAIDGLSVDWRSRTGPVFLQKLVSERCSDFRGGGRDCGG